MPDLLDEEEAVYEGLQPYDEEEQATEEEQAAEGKQDETVPVTAPVAPPVVRPPPPRFGWGVASSFNPVTGERRSASGIAPVPSPPDQSEAIRTQINVMHFQKANDAYKAAVNFQAMRAYQREIESGKSPGEALAKWGTLLPSHMSRVLQATTPAFTPQATNIGGVQGIRMGRYGERFVPNAIDLGTKAQAVEVKLPDGTVSKRYIATRGATGKSWNLHLKDTGEPVGTIGQRLQYIRDRIATLKGDLLDPTRTKMTVEAIHAAVNTLETEREELTHRKKPGEAPSAGGEAPKPKQKVTLEQAKDFLKQSKGDKEKARELARQAGYEF